MLWNGWIKDTAPLDTTTDAMTVSNAAIYLSVLSKYRNTEPDIRCITNWIQKLVGMLWSSGYDSSCSGTQDIYH